jgi:hypothetical protein
LAEDSLAPDPDRIPADLRDPFNAQIGLLTADYLLLAGLDAFQGGRRVTASENESDGFGCCIRVFCDVYRQNQPSAGTDKATSSKVGLMP